jgi:hypothetical protein
MPFSCWPSSDVYEATLFGRFHYAIRTLMHQAALQAEVDPDRLSFTRSLYIARRQVTSQAALFPSAGQSDPAGGH